MTRMRSSLRTKQTQGAKQTEGSAEQWTWSLAHVTLGDTVFSKLLIVGYISY